MARYRLNPSVVQKDLYRLLSAFMSLASVQDLHKGNPEDPLHELEELYAEDEIVHLLISTATAQRVHEDSVRDFRNDPSDSFGQAPDIVCGELTIGGKAEPLLIREACNKIIHASSIEIFDASKPVLRLEGRHGKKTWEAMVEVVEYVRASVKNLEDAV